MHFVHSLNEGGVERLLLEICSKLDRNIYETQICCLVEKGVLSPEFDKIGITLHLLNARRDFKARNIVPNVFVIFKIAKLLRQEKINISHGHEFFSTVFSRIASVLSGVKKRYITLHNVYYWWSQSVHTTQKFLSRFTTAIICNSNATLEYSLKNDGADKKKYRLIYNGVDCSKFYPHNPGNSNFLKALNVPENSFIIMTVGSISPRKGLEYLLKAASILLKEFSDITYILVGGKHINEHEEYDKILTLRSQLNLEKIVILTGGRNDVGEILTYCDLYIMPSVVEGFGLALTEAMAEEKVCIASDIDPFKEIIDDGVDGFLFKSRDEISLANKIREVRNLDAVKLNAIKKNARKKVLEKFNSENMVRQYETLYSQ